MFSGKRTPVIDAARVMEQQRTFGIPDELRNLTGESSVGNADSFDRERLFSRKGHARLLPNYFECNSPSKGTACRELSLLRYSCRFMLGKLREPVTRVTKRNKLRAARSSRCEYGHRCPGRTAFNSFELPSCGGTSRMKRDKQGVPGMPLWISLAARGGCQPRNRRRP